MCYEITSWRASTGWLSAGIIGESLHGWALLPPCFLTLFFFFFCLLGFVFYFVIFFKWCLRLDGDYNVLYLIVSMHNTFYVLWESGWECLLCIMLFGSKARKHAGNFWLSNFYVVSVINVFCISCKIMQDDFHSLNYFVQSELHFGRWDGFGKNNTEYNLPKRGLPIWHQRSIPGYCSPVHRGQLAKRVWDLDRHECCCLPWNVSMKCMTLLLTFLKAFSDT